MATVDCGAQSPVHVASVCSWELKPFLHLKLATTCQKHKEKRALHGQSHPDSQVKTIFIIQSVPAHKGSVSKGKTSLNIEQNISKCSAILSVNKQTNIHYCNCGKPHALGRSKELFR